MVSQYWQNRVISAESKVKQYEDWLQKSAKENERLKKQVQILDKALEFYEEVKVFIRQPSPNITEIFEGNIEGISGSIGDTARQARQKAKEI